MDNTQYLLAAERTEKKFPEGLNIPSSLYHEMADTFKDFLDAANRLDKLKKEIIYKDSQTFNVPVVKLEQQQAEFLHYALGMAGEVGEIITELGTDLKVQNLTHFMAELGDFRWYESGFYRHLGITQDEVQAMNFRKLSARYPDKYSDFAAVNRDTTNESAALEASA